MRDHLDTIFAAAKDEELELLGWIDDIDPSKFLVGEPFDVFQFSANVKKKVIALIMDGTTIGEYPFLFEQPRKFVNLKLKIVSVAVERNFKAV